MAETILFRLVAQDAGVNAAIVSNREEIKKLNKEIAAAKGANGYADLVRSLVEAKKSAADLKAEQKALNREFQATQVPKDSLAGLRLEYSKLTEQITKLSAAERNSDFGKGIIAGAARVKSEINGIEESVGRFTGSVGNYKKGLIDIGDLVTGGLITGGIVALVQAFGQLGSKVIDINSQVSDKIADVAKAANVSIDFVNSLSESLKARDTRTSLIDQLGIAEIGGKLGVAQDQLKGFVESVDVVNVALGDQFGGSVEQTTDVIGKLRNVLVDIKTDNIGKDIVGIGNALNFLEAQGAASAGTIADFAGRIAGIGEQFGLTSGQIIGVSATLDELGVNAERGSSGFVRILQRVSAAPAAFAKAAGVSSQEFTKLVNEDLFGAVQLFLGKLNDKNLSNTELEKVLKGLKLDGVGTVEVVGKLGGNLSLLNERAGQATKTLGETSSVTQEFEKKNATLGASVEKLSNAFSNFLTNGNLSGTIKSLVDGVTSLVGGFADLVRVSPAEQLAKDNTEFQSLVEVLRQGTASQETLNIARAKLTANFPEYIGNVDLEKATHEQLNGVLDAGNALFLKRILLETQKEKNIDFAKRELAIQQQIFEAEKRIANEKGNGPGFFQTLITGSGSADRNRALADLNQLKAEQKKAKDDAEALSQKLFGEQVDVPTINLSEQRKKALEEEKKTIEGVGTAADKSAKKQADAYELVKKRVSDLTESLNVAVASGNTNIIPKILGDLTLAQAQLQFIDARVARIKAGVKDDKRSIFQRVTNPLNDNAPAPGAGSELGADPISAEVDRAKFANSQIVDDQKLTNEELLKLKADLSDASLQFTKTELENEKEAKKKALEDEKQRRKDQIDAALDVTKSIAGAVLDIEKNRIESQKETAITALDEEYKKKIDAAQGNTVLQEKLQKELDAKKLILEKKAAKQRQDLAIKEAIVQGALAVIKALATSNFAGAIAAGVATVAEIAIIKSQKFARGGTVKFGTFGGRAHSQGGTKGVFDDGTRVEVEKDEVFAVVNKRNAPMLRKLSAVNAYGGHGSHFFEKGGALNFTPQIALPQQASLVQVLPSQATFTDAQSAQIGEIAGRKIAELLAPVVQNSIALGINDSNRRLERETALQTNRTV